MLYRTLECSVAFWQWAPERVAVRIPQNEHDIPGRLISSLCDARIRALQVLKSRWVQACLEKRHLFQSPLMFFCLLYCRPPMEDGKHNSNKKHLHSREMCHHMVLLTKNEMRYAKHLSSILLVRCLAPLLPNVALTVDTSMSGAKASRFWNALQTYRVNAKTVASSKQFEPLLIYVI